MRSMADQIWRWCIHYRGAQHNACQAGQEFKSLTVPPLPCIRRQGAEEPPLQGCQCREWPSPEYIAKEVAETEAVTRRFLLVDPMIGELKKKHPNGFSGTVTCPACQGVLHVSVSSYTRHTRGKCETADCVTWIE